MRRGPWFRLLVVHEASRLLPFRFEDRDDALAGQVFRAPPGGAVDPGESLEKVPDLRRARLVVAELALTATVGRSGSATHGRSLMDAQAELRPPPAVRVIGSPPVVMALLYLVLTYLYLSGFFFRTAFTQGPIAGLAASAMACTMMLVLYAAIGAVLERRAVSDLAPSRMTPELLTGLLVGFGLYSVCILVLMALGIYRVEGINAWTVLLTGLATPLATGVYEELLFRGGVFRLAERLFGTWIALIVSSVVFGLVHLENDAATMQGILSISVWAGILLAAAYILTGRLWLGIGLHAAWNYTQGTVYSGIVSGGAAPSAGLVKSTMQGSTWLTGGSFGVEASLIALVLCSGVGVAMLVIAVRRGRIVPPVWARGR